MTDDVLPPPVQLAIAYAPKAARPLWTALLQLDARLSRAALEVSEPVLGQIKLAWWRERFAQPAEQWPAGEPLLVALKAWESEGAALAGLVDGWEGVIGDDVAPEAVDALADARAEAIVSLARLLGCAIRMDAVQQMARFWALSDLAERTRSAEVRAMAEFAETSAVRLPRAMRPLVIIMDLPRWTDSRKLGRHSARHLARIMRLGMFGR